MKKLAAILAALLLLTSCSTTQQVKYPTPIINLNQWILTTPDPADKTLALEIRPPQLATYSSDHFHLNKQRNGIVFMVPADGVALKGSKYPRTELREINPDTSSAGWSTKQGSHTMSVTASIDSYSKTETVVVGQIHATQHYLMMIKLKGQNLHVKYLNKEIAILNPNYQLGTVFTFKFVAENGEIKVFYNNKLAVTWPSNEEPCFFKAGAYLTADPEPEDTEATVTIYKLEVNHTK